MVQDGHFRYKYDAWNRLVEVKAQEDSAAVTVQTAAFFGDGRRAKKVVTNSGDFDGTFVYDYDGQKIIETRDGSGNLYQQFVHGTQYIDELVMVRVADKGDLYVHQDANWNVLGMTDLGGNLVERHVYTPYGELTVDQGTSFGDYDGDGDVDCTDRAAGEAGGACRGSSPSGACRNLDTDGDNDVDDTDLTNFDALPQGLAIHPGRTASSVDQPFAHQGLLHEPEVGSYQNRARQYAPGMRRFMQTDPLLSRVQFVGSWRRLRHATNRFAYVSQNPTGLLDPTGLCDCSPQYRPCLRDANDAYNDDVDGCNFNAAVGLGGCSAAYAICAGACWVKCRAPAKIAACYGACSAAYGACAAAITLVLVDCLGSAQDTKERSYRACCRNHCQPDCPCD